MCLSWGSRVSLWNVDVSTIQCIKMKFQRKLGVVLFFYFLSISTKTTPSESSLILVFENGPLDTNWITLIRLKTCNISSAFWIQLWIQGHLLPIAEFISTIFDDCRLNISKPIYMFSHWNYMLNFSSSPRIFK